jgi:hypothetical protein
VTLRPTFGRRPRPRLLPTLSALVLFTDEDGCVGVGCLKEIADVIGSRLSVYLLDERRRLRELGGSALLTEVERSALRASMPVAVAGVRRSSSRCRDR